MVFRIVILLFLALQLTGSTIQAWAGFSRNRDSAQAAIEGLAAVDSLLEGGHPDRAEGLVRELLLVHGSDPIYGWQFEDRLGLSMMRVGRPDAALPWLESAIRKNPDNALGHRNLGAALMMMGRRGRALSEYQQSVELAPENFETRLEFGQVLLEFANFSEAAVHLEIARTLCPDCRELKPALAQLYLATGRVDPAIELLNVLYRENPSDDHRRTLIQALHAAGNDTLMLALWSDVALADLDSDEILLLVQTEGALARADQSLEFARSLGETENSFAELGETWRTLNGDSTFWGIICLNLLQTGHFHEGLRAADRAVSLAPEVVVFRNNRVVLLTKLGRHEEARREWEKVLEMDPTLANQENR